MQHRPNALAACTIWLALAAFAVLGTPRARAQGAPAVSPPQGYIALQQDFGAAAHTAGGFYNYDYDFELGNTAATLAGTFWANQFSFGNSRAGLPPNQVPGDQGGYLGVQVRSAQDSIAILSVWWALDARPGPGATCVDQIEMWYADDRPFDPPIRSLDDIDPARQVAGGPFRSCRLPITLQPDTRYRLRLWITEAAPAGNPDAPEWWSAWLIDLNTGHEQLIGALQLRGAWGLLNTSTGGFVEHFGPMPDGCASIPASSATFFSAQANAGTVRSTPSTGLYGACRSALETRFQSSCGSDRCTVAVGLPPLAGFQTPRATRVSYTTAGTRISVSWQAVAEATGYQLTYAPHPYTGPDSLRTIDLGNRTSVSYELFAGAAFYFAVQAYNARGTSDFSNIELFVLGAR